MSTKIIRVTVREWESATPANRSEQLAHQNFGDDGAVRELARRLTRTGRLEITELASGLHIRARSFVGRVQLGRWQITVQPKVPALPLLNLLRYAFELRHLDLFEKAGFALAEESFQDLLIHQLIAEVSELSARGLHRRYERREAILPIPRGRIDFTRYAAVAASAHAMLPCVNHPLTYDTRLNQVLLAGLRFARRLTKNPALSGELDRISKVMELKISFHLCDQAAVAEARRDLDRRTERYASALNLISLLLEARGIVNAQGTETVHLPGFLFDMNRLFQALLSRFFREHLEGCQISDEHRLEGVFRYDTQRNPLHKVAPTPRPDFVVLKPGKPAIILDAKYRDLWTRPLPREMLYQLTLYALAQEGVARTATIIYPTMDALAREQAIEFRDPVSGTRRAVVVLRPVSLLRLEELTHPTADSVQARIANQFARQLAFGVIDK